MYGTGAHSLYGLSSVWTYPFYILGKNFNLLHMCMGREGPGSPNETIQMWIIDYRTFFLLVAFVVGGGSQSGPKSGGGTFDNSVGG